MTAKMDIKYILVETVLNKKDKPVAELIKTSKVGLFKGLRDEVINDDNKPSSFLLLKSKNDELLSLNLDYYNVLSVEKFNGLSKTITYFKASADDQEAAINVLEKTIQEMKMANKMLASSDTLIDTSTYTQVPAKYDSTCNAKGSSGSSTVSKSFVSSHKPSTPYVKPAIKPSVIKRESKIPTKIMLEEMGKKIKQIQEGKYETKLPEIALDPPDSELENDDDEYNARYFVGG